VQNLDLPDRRQKTIDLYGFTTVDDSYNISYTTALSGLEQARKLASHSNKKLLVVTAGIPELSAQDYDKNFQYGVGIAQVADHAIILNSDFQAQISSGIAKNQNKSISTNICSTFQGVIQTLTQKFDPEQWLILLQPELTDLYY
jgi:UDP-N-acetylmuramyl pentapeptide synthase